MDMHFNLLCVLRGKCGFSGTREKGMSENSNKTYAVSSCSLDENMVEDVGAIAIAETLKVNITLACVKYVCFPVAHTCSDISSCFVEKSGDEERRSQCGND